MSILAHTTAAAHGLEAERRAIDATAQWEARRAKIIQAQTHCSWDEALRLARTPIPNTSSVQCRHGKGFRCKTCWPTNPTTTTP